MYKAAREFSDDVPPEVFLDVVWDFAAYPEFIHGVERVEILSDGEREQEIRVWAGIRTMSFQYDLACERLPEEVRWRRVRGAFKDAAGRMAYLGEGRYRYENALDLGFAVPGFAVRFVLKSSLPRLIRSFRDRAQERLARGAR